MIPMAINRYTYRSDFIRPRLCRVKFVYCAFEGAFYKMHREDWSADTYLPIPLRSRVYLVFPCCNKDDKSFIYLAFFFKNWGWGREIFVLKMNMQSTFYNRWFVGNYSNTFANNMQFGYYWASLLLLSIQATPARELGCYNSTLECHNMPSLNYHNLISVIKQKGSKHIFGRKILHWEPKSLWPQLKILQIVIIQHNIVQYRNNELRLVENRVCGKCPQHW